MINFFVIFFLIGFWFVVSILLTIWIPLSIYLLFKKLLSSSNKIKKTNLLGYCLLLYVLLYVAIGLIFALDDVLWPKNYVPQYQSWLNQRELWEYIEEILIWPIKIIDHWYNAPFSFPKIVF